MKKTQRKDAVRNILRQKIAFLSMVCVTLVGITGLLQVRSIMTSLKKSVEDFYARTSFQDAEISFGGGLSENSVSLIAEQMPGTEMEGIIRIEAVMKSVLDPEIRWSDAARDLKPDTEGEWNVHLISNTERISTPVLAEGRMPEEANECALDLALAQRTGLKIGDWVDLLGGPTGDPYLFESSFIITGMIYHPATVTSMRADSVLLPAAAFKDPGRYSSILVKLDIPEKIQRRALSGKYLKGTALKADAFRKILPAVTASRLEEIQQSMEENESLQYMLEESGVTVTELLDWISGENPSWDTAAPGIRSLRPDMEGMLQGQGLTLEEASAMYRELKASDAVILDRTMNESYEYVRNIYQTISRIGYFMAPLFALVAGIVFFSSAAIMIHDQRYQVGAMKAIGFSDRKIRKKYIVFGAAAGLIGCIGGTVLCSLINVRILRQWEEQFSIGGIKSRIPVAEALILTVVFLLVMAAVTHAACAYLLKCSAAGLMKGSEPKQKTLTKRLGKKRRLSLYSELIVNNIRLEKPRAVAMIIVVAVSVMMIGVGITLRHNLDKTFHAQAEDVVRFDMEIKVPTGESVDWTKDFEVLLDESGCEYAAGYDGTGLASAPGGTFGCSVLCMDRELIPQYFHVAVPEKDGITMSKNLAEAYGIRKGNTVSLYSQLLSIRETAMADTFPYYIGNLMVVPADEYRALYGSSCTNNCYFVKGSPEQIAKLTGTLEEYNAERYDQVMMTLTKDALDQFYPIRALYNVILAVILVLTVVMNLIVMINLTNILIRRRIRDLLLMRVNGFSIQQVKRYFYREMTYTIIPGIALGIIIGIPFTLFMLSRISTMKITLVVSTVWYAWVIAAAVGAVLAVAVSVISFRSVRKASMVSIPRQ